MRVLLSTILAVGFAGLACSAGLAAYAQDRAESSARRATTTALRDSMDHSRLTQVLSRFVDDEGAVDYAGLKAAGGKLLAPYLRRLAATDPASLDRDARLAFWLNAYNALTLTLIVEHHPVKNIWAVTPGPAAPKDNSPFELDVGTVGDTVRTLDEIEHEIIRPRFGEPRIHFALVCAATSCPPLRREAYTGPRLDAQLEEQTRTFLHDTAKNRVPAGEHRIALSRILKWYGQDFGASTEDLQRFMAPYFDGAVQEKLGRAAYDVTFLPYDWSLNDQERASPSEDDS